MVLYLEKSVQSLRAFSKKMGCRAVNFTLRNRQPTKPAEGEVPLMHFWGYSVVFTIYFSGRVFMTPASFFCIERASLAVTPSPRL